MTSSELTTDKGANIVIFNVTNKNWGGVKLNKLTQWKLQPAAGLDHSSI